MITAALNALIERNNNFIHFVSKVGKWETKMERNLSFVLFSTLLTSPRRTLVRFQLRDSKPMSSYQRFMLNIFYLDIYNVDDHQYSLQIFVF